GRGDRRTEASPPRQRHHPGYPLSAAAQLHHARPRPRPLPGTDRQVGRQGAGARARSQGLRLDPRGGRGVIPTEHFVGDFRRFASRAASRVPAWVADVRERAISSFSEAGFPTTRVEDWLYTNVAPVLG